MEPTLQRLFGMKLSRDSKQRTRRHIFSTWSKMEVKLWIWFTLSFLLPKGVWDWLLISASPLSITPTPIPCPLFPPVLTFLTPFSPGIQLGTIFCTQKIRNQTCKQLIIMFINLSILIISHGCFLFVCVLWERWRAL